MVYAWFPLRVWFRHMSFSVARYFSVVTPYCRFQLMPKPSQSSPWLMSQCRVCCFFSLFGGFVCFSTVTVIQDYLACPDASIFSVGSIDDAPFRLFHHHTPSHSRVGSELFVRVKSERENSALGLGHLGVNAFLSRLNCFFKTHRSIASARHVEPTVKILPGAERSVTLHSFDFTKYRLWTSLFRRGTIVNGQIVVCSFDLTEYHL